jgi:hypothetical protein
VHHRDRREGHGDGSDPEDGVLRHLPPAGNVGQSLRGEDADVGVGMTAFA